MRLSILPMQSQVELDMICKQIFYVEGRELRALNGLDLKVYILVANSPEPLTRKQIAATLDVTRRDIWLSLLRLKERFYVRQDAQGRYEKMQFFHTTTH